MFATRAKMASAGESVTDMPQQGNMGGTKASQRNIENTNGYGGFKFTAGGAGTVRVNSASMKVGGGPASATTHNLEIWSDNAGSPGAKVTNGTGSLYSTNGLTDAVVTSTFATPPELVAGTAYWLICNHGGTTNVTAYSTQSDSGTHHSGRNTTITAIVTTDSKPNAGEDWYYQIN